MKNFVWPAQDTSSLVLRMLALCLLIQLGMRYTLWAAPDRDFPFLPVADTILLHFLQPFTALLFALLLLALLGLVIFPSYKFLISVVLSASGLLVLMDINRLQIWFYFEYLLLLSFVFWTHKNSSGLALVYCRLVPFVYLWSAVHKINGFFLEQTFPWFTETFAATHFLTENTSLGWGMILAELLLGLGLLFVKTRKPAVIAGTFFHGFILLFIGPFGQNWNSVVWPWNVLMIGLLWVLFFRQKGNLWQGFISPILQSPLLLLVYLAFLLMPFLNFLQMWPDPLSFKMYAGTNTEGILYFQEVDRQCFPPAVQDKMVAVKLDSLSQKQWYLVVDDWAFVTLGVPPYGTERRLLQLAAQTCRCFSDPLHAGLEVLKVAPWKKEEPLVPLSCAKLLIKKQ